MTRATKTTKPEEADESKGPVLRVPQLNLAHIELGLIGTGSLIVKRFDEKAEEMINSSRARKISVAKGVVTEKGPADVRSIAQLVNDARHLDIHGRDSVPAGALAQAIRGAKARVPGNEQSKVISEARVRSVTVLGDYLTILGSSYTVRSDPGRNPANRAGIVIHRPEYKAWGLLCVLRYNTALLCAQDVINLVALAGEYCGLCEWRPSAPKNPGNHGTFRIANPAETKELKKLQAQKDAAVKKKAK